MIRKLLLATALITTASRSAQAQYGIPRGPKCLEVGYSYGVATAEFNYHDREFNEGTGKLTDTSFSRRLTSKVGFGGVLGYYFPVMKLGDASRFAISVSYMYDAYLWDGTVFAYSANTRTGVDESVGSGTIEMALPVGLDYKNGCDATFDKSKRFCFTAGAGVYPSFGVTVYQGNGGLAFHARPYVKGEIGFFAGICFKVRAMYALGNIPYIDYVHTGAGYDEGTTFKSTGTLNLSLILMPMSWKWGRTQWWN